MFDELIGFCVVFIDVVGLEFGRIVLLLMVIVCGFCLGD